MIAFITIVTLRCKSREPDPWFIHNSSRIIQWGYSMNLTCFSTISYNLGSPVNEIARLVIVTSISMVNDAYSIV